MSDNSHTIEQGLLAALKLAEHKDWSRLTLAEIAEAAELPLSAFRDGAGKDQIADAVEGYFDSAMSAEGATTDGSPRERLFEAIMLRFEAMEEYRPGLLSLMKYRETSPSRLAHLVGARRKSAEWALVCAGLDDDAVAAKTLKVVAVGYVIAMTERAWRKEDSADFTKTMSVLDRELRQAEDRLGWLKRFTGQTHKEPEPDEE